MLISEIVKNLKKAQKCTVVFHRPPYLNAIIQIMKNKWTIPKVKSYPIESGKQWYVWFRFNGGNPIRVKEGINQKTTFEERMIEAEATASYLKDQLKKGWIPAKAKFIKEPPKFTIVEAADFAYKRKSKIIDASSAENYLSAINFFKEACKDLGYSRMFSIHFERTHAKDVLEHLQVKKTWKNKNLNKNLGFLRSMFYEALDAGYFKTNPFGEIKNLKVPKTFSNIPPTDEEMELICDELQAKNFGFYIFFMLIYYCGFRPEELRLLKIKSIDFEGKNIIPEVDETKTDTLRIVPMLGNIEQLLSPYKDCDPELYVFGTWVPNGGRHSQRNWFLPNKYQLKDDTPNRQWKKLIKDGLGIQKNLYSGKHKGGDDKLAAGMDIDTISKVFGHSKTLMTERYLHSLKLKQLNEARKIKLKIY